MLNPGAPLPPLILELEFARAEQAGDPYAFRPTAQDYLLRSPGGGFENARFAWEPELLADLNALRLPGRDPAIAQRLGELLRRFLATAGWAQHEAKILEALPAGRPILLTIRSAAAELYALPWELITLKSTGQHIGELPAVLLRYEWPETASADPATPRAAGGRILLAWSAAGGAVPAVDHQAQLGRAAQQGFHPFDPAQDVLPEVSCGRLVATLAAASRDNRPIAVLHLLCHGAANGSTFGLALSSEEPGSTAVVVDAGRLRQLLAPHAAMLRLVVLCACDSGNSGALGNQLGSIAQTLHRAGIAAVVASRYPLSVAGSVRLTEELYGQLLVKLGSLEGALRTARARLAEDAAGLDWASVQLYTRCADGDDSRPVVFRPFRGLLTFLRRHDRFFFGRDALIAQIVSALAALTAAGKPRLLMVAGASGAGKSSVVLAGAVPQLCGANPALRFASLRPGQDPQAALTQALRDAPAAAAPSGRPLLLVVDQFEEVFTHSESFALRQSFVRQLWQLASDPAAQVSVIVTLRVDFIGRCGELVLDDTGKRLDVVAYDDAHRVFVPQLDPPSLQAAIERPAQQVGLVFSDGLLQRMITDVGGEPGALPLLEDTLDLLWQKRSERTLTQAAYDEVGGVAGALQGRADALFAALSAEEQRVARRLLVRLVNVGEDLTQSTRRRVPLLRLRPSAAPAAAQFDHVLAKLVDARLLVRDGQGSAQLVEVAHEALIRKWRRLGEWVQADRQMLAELDKVEGWVRQWGDMKTLLVGSQLGFAERVVEDYPDDCPAKTIELLQQSRAFARRRARLQKGLVTATILAAICMGVFGVIGVHLAGIANEEAKTARDGLRLRWARELVDSSPDTAASLLRELEAEDPGAIKGWRQTAIASQGSAAQLVSQWNLPLQRPAKLIALSPDCVHAAVLEADQTGRLFEKERPLGPIALAGLAGAAASFTAMALSPDARSLVTRSVDRSVRVWSISGSAPPLLLPGQSDGAAAQIAFSPDGQRILLLDSPELVRSWISDGKSGSVLGPLHAPGNHEADLLHPLAWSLAVLTGNPPRFRVWNQKASHQVLFSATPEVDVATICSDPNQFATATRAGQLRLWRLGQPPLSRGLSILPLPGAHRPVFSPDGQKLVLSNQEGSSQVWDLKRGTPPLRLEWPVPVTPLGFSPDGTRVLAVGEDGTARLANADGGGAQVALQGQYHPSAAVSFSPDGAQLAIIDRNYQARLLSSATGEPVRELSAAGEHATRVAFSPDGSKLGVVVAGRGGSLASGEFEVRLGTAAGPGTPLRIKARDLDLAFSATSQQLWTAPVGTAQLWRQDGNTAPQNRAIALPFRPDEVFFSPNGGRLALTGSGRIAVLGTDDDKKPRTWGFFDLTQEVSLSQDGSRILVKTQRRQAMVLNSDGTSPPIELALEDADIKSTALSPDGKLAILIGNQASSAPWVWNLDHLEQTRPEALRRSLWQSGASCLNTGESQEFLNRPSAVSGADISNCYYMLGCLNKTDGSEPSYRVCLKQFRTLQSRWQWSLIIRRALGK